MTRSRPGSPSRKHARGGGQHYVAVPVWPNLVRKPCLPIPLRCETSVF